MGSKDDRWSYDELRRKLGEFEKELREAGLAENSVQTYVNRSEVFLRWLIGDYRPRGPVA